MRDKRGEGGWDKTKKGVTRRDKREARRLEGKEDVHPSMGPSLEEDAPTTDGKAEGFRGRGEDGE